MSESEKLLRQQMTDAIENIRNQLDLLRSGPSIGGPLDNRSVIADLEAELLALGATSVRVIAEPGQMLTGMKACADQR